MKWKKAVENVNAKRFVIPDGWDTKEQIAQELQCAVDRVGDLLKPGLASGAFEAQDFQVWDAKRRLSIKTRCYRHTGVEANPKKSSSRGLESRIKAAIARYPNRNNSTIAKSFRRVSAELVESLR